jgi:hypothetical protein
MDSPWSDELRFLLRPIATARAVGAREPLRREIFARVLRHLILIGVFVAFTTAGRLAPFHVASTVVFWSFAPALQATAVAFATLVVSGRRAIRPALDLYFVGHAPWLLFGLGLAAVTVIAPDPSGLLLALLARGVLPILLLLVIVLGVISTTIAFVFGLRLGARRGAVATLLFYAIEIAALAIWYLAVGQVQTLFVGGA